MLWYELIISSAAWFKSSFIMIQGDYMLWSPLRWTVVTWRRVSHIIGKLNLEFRTLMSTVSKHAFFGSREVQHCVWTEPLQFEISGTQLWILANFRPKKGGTSLKAAHSACVHTTTFWGSNIHRVSVLFWSDSNTLSSCGIRQGDDRLGIMKARLSAGLGSQASILPD